MASGFNAKIKTMTLVTHE